MIAWHAGDRDVGCAQKFMMDVASRVVNRIQLTTDGHWAYRKAVPAAFGRDIDYAMLVKYYGAPRDGEQRYSPCECVGAEKVPIIGRSAREDVCTSHIERQNLTLRMANRRFTRLTNAFSRRLANLRASLAIHYVYYNFCRVHQSLRVTPAMQAEITDRVWDLAEIVGILEAEERSVIGTEANKRGPYKRRAKIQDLD
jgi:hypothetical protein